MKASARVVLLVVLLGAMACSNSAQKEAYHRAVTLEQQLPADQLVTAKAAYEKVVQMDPMTKWAREARTRLTAVEAKIHAKQKTDEMNESVFHQTGID